MEEDRSSPGCRERSALVVRCSTKCRPKRLALDTAVGSPHQAPLRLSVLYQDWVRSGYPEGDAGLLWLGSGFWVAPDDVGLHRQLTAEWLAQR